MWNQSFGEIVKELTAFVKAARLISPWQEPIVELECGTRRVWQGPHGDISAGGYGQEAGHVERQTVSIMKACELVGVSRRTIYNWIAAGKVEYVRTAGGSIRIFVDTLWRQPDGSAPTAPNVAV